MADDIELRIEPARESDTPTVLRWSGLSLPVPGRRPDTGLDQLPHHWSSLRPTRRGGTVRQINELGGYPPPGDIHPEHRHARRSV